MVWFRWVVAVALLAALAGCSGPSHLCDYAAGLVDDHHLTEAARAYAEAQRVGEGSCADDGLDEVVEQQAAGRRSYEQGMAAARAGDLPKAKASLQAALRTDQGDVQAAVELRRLGQTPSIRAVPSSVTVTNGGSGGPGGPLVWAAVAGAALASALVLAAWFRRERWAAEIVASVSGPLRTDMSVFGRKVTDIDADDLRRRLEETRQQLAGIDAGGLRRRLDETKQQLADLGMRLGALEKNSPSGALSMLRTAEADRVVRGLMAQLKAHELALDRLAGSDESARRLIAGLAEIVRAEERFVDEHYGTRSEGHGD
ncbi:hypothetical protein [Paractinoplanes maris]|uniref:hypothetical protein n=1 Tax=Paractinoplanes maris TaxID=1734446 RepID=UPI0020214C7F|nr:hypothetical protein [Actinoplanes maris]